jgi:hypothetical protein
MEKPQSVKPQSRPASASAERRRASAEPLVDPIPTLAEARRRLAAAKNNPQPWLTPAGRAALSNVPEILGPKTVRKG